MAKKKVFIVDDEEILRLGIKKFLDSEGLEVKEAENCKKAEALFQSSRPDLAILDYQLPDGTALDLLPKLKAIHAGIPIIILTAHGTIDLAVQAIKEGAEQFLTKPIEMSALIVIINRLLENQRIKQKHLAGKTRNGEEPINPFFGNSPAMENLKKKAKKLCLADGSVLILGETGIGKGVLANWLHHHSERQEEAMVELNCAGLNREFLESELFGHEKGAFTGAVNKKVGLLEVAHHGTVFLDEIGDMDLSIQPKVLKVLEDKRFRKLGDIQDIQVDVRMIFATHQDLGCLIQEKKFRSDLFYRINTFPISIPPLRERPEDIHLLTKHFVKFYASKFHREPLELSSDAEKKLMAYFWPGNIRELKNLMERVVLLGEGKIIEAQDLNFDLSSHSGTSSNDPNLSLAQVEQRHIELVLKREKGKVINTAKKLGISKSALYQKIKDFNIEISKY